MRYQYTASACPKNISGDFCISEWDVLPGSLPAGHKNLVWGHSPLANYTNWAMPGSGASQLSGGSPGSSGTFVVRTSGDFIGELITGITSVFSQEPGITTEAMPGTFLQGGTGAGGKMGGGGGGGKSCLS